MLRRIPSSMDRAWRLFQEDHVNPKQRLRRWRLWRLGMEVVVVVVALVNANCGGSVLLFCWNVLDGEGMMVVVWVRDDETPLWYSIGFSFPFGIFTCLEDKRVVWRGEDKCWSIPTAPFTRGAAATPFTLTRPDDAPLCSRRRR